MADKRSCLNCGRPFKVRRDAASRHAKIRYCGACKDDFEEMQQQINAIISEPRHAYRGTREYLAKE